MEDFKKHLHEAVNAEKMGDVNDIHVRQDYALRIYIPYLMGVNLFTDKSTNYVHKTCLKYFRGLELVSDYVRGAAALAHLYRKLNRGTHYKTSWPVRYLTCYMYK